MASSSKTAVEPKNNGSFKSAITSYLFQFLVGPEEKEFNVHVDIIARQSPTLATLVQGAMAEAQRRCAYLRDCDEDTFARFVEYAYTGGYTVEEPVTVPLRLPGIDTSEKETNGKSKSTDSEEIILTEESTLPRKPGRHAGRGGDSWGFWGVSSKRDKKKKCKRSAKKKRDVEQHGRMWTKLNNNAEHTFLSSSWEPRQNKDPSEDFTPVFMSHADLYVFADAYGIKELKELVVDRLRLTLIRFELYQDRVGDVVHLLRHVYSCTQSYSDRTKLDPLRELTLEYTVAQIGVMNQNEDFREYMHEEGSHAVELLNMIADVVLKEPSDDDTDSVSVSDSGSDSDSYGRRRRSSSRRAYV